MKKIGRKPWTPTHDPKMVISEVCDDSDVTIQIKIIPRTKPHFRKLNDDDFLCFIFWYNLQRDYLVCFIFYLSCQNLEFWSLLTHKGIQFQFQIVFRSIQFQMSAYCILRTISWILNKTISKCIIMDPCHTTILNKC